MARIIQLPSEVSRKIAAGEVIERPFSVVKELVENSLDAGASEIRVEVQEGGRKLIRVSDDGLGMSREDALFCFRRHSTSKISSEEDLESIKTLGFRGEALPSISAVSRVTLMTSEGKEGGGIRIDREGEKVLEMQEAALPRGTVVEVRDLFFNLPARRKFLRSERSEIAWIIKGLILSAMAHHRVRFSLRHGKRRVFDYPAVSTLRERIFQVYGKATLEGLVEVDFEEDGRRISGYVSRPPTGRRDRNRQFFFVNRRPVKDRMLQAALNQALRAYLEKERFAEAFLFLEVPCAEVDVNVHPAKAEVRFREPKVVFRLLRRGLASALVREIAAKEVYPRRPEKIPVSAVGEKEERWDGQARLAGIPEREPDAVHGPVPSIPEAGKSGPPRVLGQYLDTYIVAADDEGLLVIDQHNAHERVLFERYERIDREGGWPRKIPLLPVLLELSPGQVADLEQSLSILEETGFRVEEMGGRSYALKEYPDIFSEEEAKEALLGLIEEVKEEAARTKKEKLLAGLACRTAVKAGQTLSPQKMDFLVEELFRTRNPFVCPHGRPITLRLDRRKLEREIGRKS